MKNDVLFSVIMPVYNVEKYINKSVDSVLKQGYENFELILVDDKTPDGSGIICDRYAEKDSRVKVIHKPQNEGLGFARNTGLVSATGDYIIFMDSDDWIEPDTLEKIYGYLKETPVDILAFGFYHDYLDKNSELIKTDNVAFKNDIIAQNSEDIARVVMEMDLGRNFPYAWSKAYSHTFLKEKALLFDKTKLMEDFVFNIAAFGKADSVRIIKDTFYHYIKPSHTTLASAYDKSFFNLCKMRYEKEYELLKNAGVTDEFCYQAARDIFIKHILSAVLRDLNKKSGLSFSEKYKHAKEILKDSKTVEVLKTGNSSSKQIKVLQFIFKNRMVLATMMLAYIYSKMN